MNLRKPHPHTTLAIILGLFPVAAAIIIIIVTIAIKDRVNNKPLTEQTDTTATPTATATVQPVAEPSSTATATPSATATATSTATETLPDSAKSFLANFYTAYKAKDSSRMATMITTDTGDDSQTHSTLFKGVDLNGNPGGPTLFSSNGVPSESVQSYSILNSVKRNSNWTVTVREQRVNNSGASVGERTTTLTLAPASESNGNWLIDSYIPSGGTGKYSAFLVQ